MLINALQLLQGVLEVEIVVSLFEKIDLVKFKFNYILIIY